MDESRDAIMPDTRKAYSTDARGNPIDQARVQPVAIASDDSRKFTHEGYSTYSTPRRIGRGIGSTRASLNVIASEPIETVVAGSRVRVLRKIRNLFLDQDRRLPHRAWIFVRLGHHHG